MNNHEYMKIVEDCNDTIRAACGHDGKDLAYGEDHEKVKKAYEAFRRLMAAQAQYCSNVIK